MGTDGFQDKDKGQWEKMERESEIKLQMETQQTMWGMCGHSRGL
jgi:hypothetical protein